MVTEKQQKSGSLGYYKDSLGSRKVNKDASFRGSEIIEVMLKK